MIFDYLSEDLTLNSYLELILNESLDYYYDNNLKTIDFGHINFCVIPKNEDTEKLVKFIKNRLHEEFQVIKEYATLKIIIWVSYELLFSNYKTLGDKNEI